MTINKILMTHRTFTKDSNVLVSELQITKKSIHPITLIMLMKTFKPGYFLWEKIANIFRLQQYIKKWKIPILERNHLRYRLACKAFCSDTRPSLLSDQLPLDKEATISVMSCQQKDNKTNQKTRNDTIRVSRLIKWKFTKQTTQQYEVIKCRIHIWI